MNAYYFFFILSCFSIFSTWGQFHEIGIHGGGSNYIGDVGTKYFISPNSHVVGLFYRLNYNNRYAFRAGVNVSVIKGSDLQTDDLSRFRRQFQFENPIQELYAGMELNFVSFDVANGYKEFSPYLFYGVGYMRHQLFYISPNTPNLPTVNPYGHKFNFVFPVALGVKYKPSERVVAGLELGVRYTLTDNIDGSDPIPDLSNQNGFKFGNAGNNDFYIFTGITISFTFGNRPCYCD